MKKENGLYIPLNGKLCYRHGDYIFEITPRVVHSVHRDGSPATVYDLSSYIENGTEMIYDHGTFFSVDSALQAIRNRTTERNKTGIKLC